MGRWQVECEGVVWRRDQRRQHDLARKSMTAFALRDARFEPRCDATALGIQRANVRDVEERTIIRRKTVFSADLFDQGEGVAQAPSKDELGVFASLNPAFDEIQKAENIVLYAMVS